MKKVLVIDDDACVREVIRDVLESSECRVLEAEAGYEGIELAKSDNPDLVIVDFLMPGVTGVQILHILRTSPLTWDIPVLLISGVHADELVMKALVMDQTAYLMKPFTPSQLLAKVQEISNMEEGRKRGAQADGLRPFRAALAGR